MGGRKNGSTEGRPQNPQNQTAAASGAGRTAGRCPPRWPGADLNRGTFYFHYTDTYDLRNQIEDELVEELKEAIAEFQPEQAEFSLRPMLKKVFDYVLSQKFLFRTFFRSSSNSGLQNKVMAVVEENIDNARSELEVNESERSRKYHSRFM